MRWYQPRRTKPIRLEPQPWTGRTRRKRLPEIVTTVKAKSAYGIKTDEWGDEWANWSKVEFRGEPFNTAVKAGDRVQLTYAEADNGKVYISTIDKVTGGLGGQVQEGARKMQQAARETNAVDDPLPPEEEFRGDNELPPDATESPSQAEAVYGQELWAKDKLRARTDCIACATGIFKSCLEAGILKEFPSAAAVVAYATELEKWANG